MCVLLRVPFWGCLLDTQKKSNIFGSPPQFRQILMCVGSAGLHHGKNTGLHMLACPQEHVEQRGAPFLLTREWDKYDWIKCLPKRHHLKVDPNFELRKPGHVLGLRKGILGSLQFFRHVSATWGSSRNSKIAVPQALVMSTNVLSEIGVVPQESTSTGR